MKTKIYFKVGDVVFNVDPQKLIISRFSIIKVDSDTGNIVIVKFENSISPKQKQILLSLSEFSKENKARLYFQTEDEAQKFVKIQIGM